jgi:hypothetical protein
MVLLAAAASVALSLDQAEPLSPVFSRLPAPATPFAPTGDAISFTWYCPGVPVNGADGFGGEVVIANPGDVDASGRITVFTPDQAPVVAPVEVPVREVLVVDVAELVTAPFAGVMVELFEGRGVVEQRAIHPVGAAVAPCANSTSATWFFADGTTAQGSVSQIVLTNPFPGAAVVDLSFVTASGPRSPRAFQGFVLRPESTTVITLGQNLAQDESRLAVSIRATTGRFVAGRSQHYLGGGRLGYTMTLGAPSLDDQWWFADGEVGEGITEQLVVFNPSENDVTADVVFLGVTGSAQAEGDGFIEPVTLNVPAGEVSVLDVGGLGVLPTGRHGTVVSTLAADSIVVERVMTRPAGDFVATTVVLGVQPSFVSSRWYAPTGVPFALEDALVALNVTGLPGAITVNAIGPGGPSPLPGLEGLPIDASGLLALDLPAEAAGRDLYITADVQLVVERLLPRREDLRGRSGSLAVPE